MENKETEKETKKYSGPGIHAQAVLGRPALEPGGAEKSHQFETEWPADQTVRGSLVWIWFDL